MTRGQMMTLPIKVGNLMMAKAEALDTLIENNIVCKEQIIAIGNDDWFGDYLSNKWGIEND